MELPILSAFISTYYYYTMLLLLPRAPCRATRIGRRGGRSTRAAAAIFFVRRLGQPAGCYRDLFFRLPLIPFVCSVCCMERTGQDSGDEDVTLRVVCGDSSHRWRWARSPPAGLN